MGQMSMLLQNHAFQLKSLINQLSEPYESIKVLRGLRRYLYTFPDLI